ncbi:hypothetical protein DV738_g1736, partial [Chaetothyriales sp. CBS 135597]
MDQTQADPQAQDPERTDSKPTKSFSCLRCFERKVKCDKNHPCGNCIKANIECNFRTPSAPRRKKKKRETEEILLDRLRYAEFLLQSNGILLDSVDKETPLSKAGASAQTLFSSRQAPFAQGKLIVDRSGSRSRFIDNNLWSFVSAEFRDPKDAIAEESSDDGDGDTVAEDENTEFLFGLTPSASGLGHLHPHQEGIFKLWALFLENVNPMTKIIHYPTLQEKLVQASQDIDNIDRGLEALMFAIYLSAVTSLDDIECERTFKESRRLLLARYRQGARRSLSRARFLGTADIQVLQAFVLYLLMMRQYYDSRTMWTLTGVANRIAHGMGIHRDGTALGLPPFETEMRRRLWWQITSLDFRSAELTGSGRLGEIGLSDTQVPTNTNDSDIWPGMPDPPVNQTYPTEVLTCLMRCEFGAFWKDKILKKAMRGRLDARGIFLSPKEPPSGDNGSWYLTMDEREKYITELEERLHTKFLQYCDHTVPLQLMASLIAKAAVGSMRLMAHYPKGCTTDTDISESRRQFLWETAVRLIQTDNVSHATRALKKFKWHIDVYFQWHALIYLLGELTTRTRGHQVDEAWKQIDECWDNHPQFVTEYRKPLHVAVGNLCLKAYEARSRSLKEEYGEKKAQGVFVLPHTTPGYIEMLRQQRETPKRKDSKSTWQSSAKNALLNATNANQTSASSAFSGLHQPVGAGGLRLTDASVASVPRDPVLMSGSSHNPLKNYDPNLDVSETPNGDVQMDWNQWDYLIHDLEMPNLSGSWGFRESETADQQKYEADILEQHYPQERIEMDKQHLAGLFPEEEITGKGIKGKLKGFWNKTVVPAFPEAVGDISLIRTAINVETSISKDIKDPTKYPEIAQVAEVRKGLSLCPAEIQYLAQRKEITRLAFCKYLDLDPSTVHPDDVPVVSFGGSGGGYRAMIGLLGYCEEMKATGFWDLLTYVSGVSGSCWSLAAYYTWGEAKAVRELLQTREGALKTLGPLIQKHKSGLSTVAMDLYAVFSTGYLFLTDPATDPKRVGHEPKAEVPGHPSHWLKWTSATSLLEGGKEPLPILTAIRHERPWKDWADDAHPFKEADPTGKEHSEATDAWFQWFEISPYEIGCDELEAWVPTWGFGRPFEKGKSTMQLPEQSLALLLGLCTSAPAGPLTSYLATIKRNLPAGFIGDSITNISRGVAKFWGKQGTEEFQQHHPLHACNEHNFLYHLNYDPDKGASRGIENSPRIHLIDSGMDNNCPTYVLTHPERKVDVIVNLDASSDVQKDTFQERADQIGSRRGLKFVKRDPTLKAGTDPKDPDRFKGLYAQIYDGTVLKERPETVTDSYGREVKNPPAPPSHQDCTMVYLPILPNEAAVKDYDPSTAKFSGSYNLVWTQEQVQMLLDSKEQLSEEDRKILEEYHRNSKDPGHPAHHEHKEASRCLELGTPNFDDEFGCSAVLVAFLKMDPGRLEGGGTDGPVDNIHVLTLNCWGLKYLSKLRSERLSEIGNRLAAYSPALDIVGLQECWTYADYSAIRDKVQHVLPYSKFYYSGIFGGGLVILSRWPIEESSMFRYPLNGRPTAFFRGDWFVGKGVACAKLRVPDGPAIEVFNTHLHAPYEREPNDSYICHRTAQAWEISKLMKNASERGSIVLGLGDFNMVPLSFAHTLVENRGRVRDAWRIIKPASSIGASIDDAEKQRRVRMNEKPCPDVQESLGEHGHTCDSVLNTWRWTKDERKALEKGTDRTIAPTDQDPKAKRLDYIFFGYSQGGWGVRDVKVALTERHPELRCSLSDHFAVEATLVRRTSADTPVELLDAKVLESSSEGFQSDREQAELKDGYNGTVQTQSVLGLSFYDDILKMIHKYTLRERKQRRWRLWHFLASALISIGCFIAVWWSPRNYVAFILILISSLGLMAGTVDGLIGGLFVGSELRALAEFEWEVRNAMQLAGGPRLQEAALRDWYD